MKIKYQTIERITITCPYAERQAAYDKLYDEGYDWLSTRPIMSDGNIQEDVIAIVGEKRTTPAIPRS
jgi:hypothetical protein